MAQTFLASDGSTAELVRQLASDMHRPARLLPVPAAIVRAAATVLGRRDLYERLCGSLEVDGTKARTEPG